MNYRFPWSLTPDLYNYHVDIIRASGAYIYRASFALDDELTDRHNTSGSAPSVAACIDDITEWREGVINDAAKMTVDETNRTRKVNV